MITLLGFILLISLLTWGPQPAPHKYDYASPGMIVQFAAPNEIARWCGNRLAIGCSYGMGRRCTILLPHGTRKRSMLYRHEQAHCNGWTADHPRPFR